MTKRFVAVAGNVGVGKSTLTALLAERLGWEPFFEAVDDNPYLADFYKDMRQWAFHSQIFFLSRRLRHHYELLSRPHSVIQDRSVYEDAEIFARNLYEQGSLDERDYQSYRELYQTLCDLVPPPDLVIYLQADVKTLLDRIRKRGRPYEQDIDPAYLARLNRLYDRWIDSFVLCPVLKIRAASIDFVAHPQHLDRIVASLQEKLAGKEILVLE
ncbi:MAG: deoxynucleoside kinase [Caldilineae bacterium]|nr:MAG: deoxynucleoside kinase [Caldilineae bacterium]